MLRKAKKIAKKRHLTYQKIGEAMGYPPDSARQSVNQFLNGSNPTVRMMLKFAEAIGVDPRDLL